MKKYEMPKAQMISRNDLDIICTSSLILPIIPLFNESDENPENENEAL